MLLGRDIYFETRATQMIKQFLSVSLHNTQYTLTCQCSVCRGRTQRGGWGLGHGRSQERLRLCFYLFQTIDNLALYLWRCIEKYASLDNPTPQIHLAFFKTFH